MLYQIDWQTRKTRRTLKPPPDLGSPKSEMQSRQDRPSDLKSLASTGSTSKRPSPCPRRNPYPSPKRFDGIRTDWSSRLQPPTPTGRSLSARSGSRSSACADSGPEDPTSGYEATGGMVRNEKCSTTDEDLYLYISYISIYIYMDVFHWKACAFGG